jgi:rieske iron-sulfur protein
MTRKQPKETARCCCEEPVLERRMMMLGAAAMLLAGTGPSLGDDDAAKTARPQIGDVLIEIGGDEEAKVLKASDLKIGGEPTLAYPADPATGLVRSGSRINQILLARVDPATLSGEMRETAESGIVGYSAICTHNGCPITSIQEDKHSVICNCHGSVFDLSDNGKVLDGPAMRKIARLPLKVSGETITVAGAFIGMLGPQKQ